MTPGRQQAQHVTNPGGAALKARVHRKNKKKWAVLDGAGVSSGEVGLQTHSDRDSDGGDELSPNAALLHARSRPNMRELEATRATGPSTVQPGPGPRRRPDDSNG